MTFTLLISTPWRIYQILFLLCLVSTGFTGDMKIAGIMQPGRLSQDGETGAPLPLQHLHAHLRNNAHVFYITLKEISPFLENSSFVQYIKKVVTEDGIGIELETKAPTYKAEELESQQEDDNKISCATFSRIAKQLPVNNELANNPFSLYFRGFFAYHGFLFSEDEGDPSFLADKDDSKGKEIETKEPHLLKAAQLLNLASKYHYVRAPTFIIVKELWDDVELSKSKLK